MVACEINPVMTLLESVWKMAAMVAASNSAWMAVSPAIWTVTARLSSMVLRSPVNLALDGALTKAPEMATACPAPYLVRISGMTTPMLSVVTVKLRNLWRISVMLRVFPVE